MEQDFTDKAKRHKAIPTVTDIEFRCGYNPKVISNLTLEV